MVPDGRVPGGRRRTGSNVAVTASVGVGSGGVALTAGVGVRVGGNGVEVGRGVAAQVGVGVGVSLGDGARLGPGVDGTQAKRATSARTSALSPTQDRRLRATPDVVLS